MPHAPVIVPSRRESTPICISSPSYGQHSAATLGIRAVIHTICVVYVVSSPLETGYAKRGRRDGFWIGCALAPVISPFKGVNRLRFGIALSTTLPSDSNYGHFLTQSLYRIRSCCFVCMDNIMGCVYSSMSEQLSRPTSTIKHNLPSCSLGSVKCLVRVFPKS